MTNETLFVWQREKNCFPNGNEILQSILLLIIIITWKQKRNQLVRVQKEPLMYSFPLHALLCFMFLNTLRTRVLNVCVCVWTTRVRKNRNRNKKKSQNLFTHWIFYLSDGDDEWRLQVYKWNRLSGLQSKRRLIWSLQPHWSVIKISIDHTRSCKMSNSKMTEILSDYTRYVLCIFKWVPLKCSILTNENKWIWIELISVFIYFYLLCFVSFRGSKIWLRTSGQISVTVRAHIWSCALAAHKVKF